MRTYQFSLLRYSLVVVSPFYFLYPLVDSTFPIRIDETIILNILFFEIRTMGEMTRNGRGIDTFWSGDYTVMRFQFLLLFKGVVRARM